MMWVITTYLLTILPALVSVAFVTLLERKVLGLSQYRKGPNKVSLAGILQPIADVVKLFVKEITILKEGNYLLFFVSPSIGFILMLWMMINLPNGHHLSITQVLMMILAAMSLNIYPLFLSGWSSNSKYALLGSIRGVAQTISYEIALALALFIMMFVSNTQLNLSLATNHASSNILLFTPVLVLLFICCIAETNRTPFDFSEGESELVSGFNTEYGGGTFALIFMAEYGMIVFFSLFLSFLVFPAEFLDLSFLLAYLTLLFLWIWLRTTFPRYRYDKLLNLAWKSILPWTLALISYYFSINFF